MSEENATSELPTREQIAGHLKAIHGRSPKAARRVAEDFKEAAGLSEDEITQLASSFREEDGLSQEAAQTLAERILARTHNQKGNSAAR